MIKRYIPSYSCLDVGRLLLSREASLRVFDPVPGRRAEVHFFNSATDGLVSALARLCPPGKVGISAYTCIKVPDALRDAGFDPVFLEVDPRTGLSHPSTLDTFQPGDLVAVIATHMFGLPCDMDAYRIQAERLGALLVEDCAAAFGSHFRGMPVGSQAPVSIFSFGRGKTLNLGGGGALVLNFNPDVHPGLKPLQLAPVSKASLFQKLFHYLKLVAFSREGWVLYFSLFMGLKRLAKKEWFWEEHTSSSPSKALVKCQNNLNIHFGYLGQMIGIPKQLAHRKLIASIYQANIIQSEAIFFMDEGDNVADVVRPAFPLRVKNRKGLFLFLRLYGIDCGLSFSYSSAACYGVHCPGAETLSQELITLPVHSGVSVDRAHQICAIVNSWGDEETSRFLLGARELGRDNVTVHGYSSLA